MSEKNPERDYSAISPSAKSLVLLKGVTNIPFARETAELISLPEAYQPDFDNKDFAFWKRVVHFESRYWSVNQLLSELTIENVLELSSGYSFRGLETVQEKSVQYIDTDLPDVIAQKTAFLQELQKGQTQTKGNLTTLPLNALDEPGFKNIVSRFSPGPIVIVNEGLMMYLNIEEKSQLCRIIYDVLKERGGYWITGDIYVKSTLERLNENEDDSLKDLVEQQRIEENMFDSFEQAQVFFENAGFVIDKEAELDLSKISSLHYLVQNASEGQLKELQSSRKKVQATWRLRV